MFYFQILLAVVGMILMFTSRIPLGPKVLYRPFTTVMGLLFLAPLLLSIALGFILGVSEVRESIGDLYVNGPWDTTRGVRADAEDDSPEVKQEAKTAKAQKRASGRWWFEAITLCIFTVMGFGLAFIGLRDTHDPLLGGSSWPAGALLSQPAPLVLSPREKLPSASGEDVPLPHEVLRYHSKTANVPPEVAALGEADHMHPPKNAMMRWKEPPTYIVFRHFLMIVDGNDYTVIPWKAIKELQTGKHLTTTEGETFPLHTDVQEYGRLVNKLQLRLLEQFLPPALATMQSGHAVTIGPFAVSREGIGYQSKALPWGNVMEMRLATLSKSPLQRGLVIRDLGDNLLPWCQVALDFPNDFLLLELIKRVCPSHLLEAPEPLRRV